MLLTTCAPKKPLRSKEFVTMFPLIDERVENIELDSLENEIFEEETKSELAFKTEQSKKNLNLNNICQNYDGITNKEIFVEDIVLARESIQCLTDLETLSLRYNGINNFPKSVLQLTSLKVLDLSDNNLQTLPHEISLLVCLEELLLDQNLLSVLPITLWDLKCLVILKVANNRITIPPDRLTDMKSIILSELDEKCEEYTQKTNGISTLNLRSNKLKGNIILGNYGNLIELDVSENNIETLNLSAVELLETLQCSRNVITNLTVHGRKMVSIIAGNNRIKNLTFLQPPTNLRHMDVSYNVLEALPEWLCGCSELRCLFASNNNLTNLPDHLFCNEMPYLHTLQLAYNHLQYLPSIQRRLPIQEMFLQNNSLSTLPDNLFMYVSDLKVLNLSNNRLCDLPDAEGVLHLEKLFLTANCLIGSALIKISSRLRNLKILHAAYNNFTTLPEDCALHWSELEELVLSGNKLFKLPSNIGQMRHLSVLRVHSNHLQTVPTLSKLLSLRVLDLAHNQLDRIDLGTLIPPNLKFLDLSCNTKLHVDSQQFHNYRTQRPMSLVDVSGKNRTSLPLSPCSFTETDLTESSWSVGFSETSGAKNKLYISQIRLPAFCNTEALFGMFDGEQNNFIPSRVDKFVPRLLLEERTAKETSVEYMKHTLIASYCQLKCKNALNRGILVHILKSQQNTDYSFSGTVKKYLMKIASFGDITCVLGRAAGPVRLLPHKQRKTVRTNPQLNVVQDPDVADVYLNDHDEYMIIANRNLWEVITPDSAIKEVSLQRNVILAAKRLQDLAQSYGAEDNLSIIVVKFNILGNDVDLLMRELRQTFRKNKYQDSVASTCVLQCCCDSFSNDCPSCLEKLPPPIFDDRSSPSGQSDHNCSDYNNSSAKLYINKLNKVNETKTLRSITPSIFGPVDIKPSPERRSYRGVARAVRAKREEERAAREDSDSALSEEQFKCWEYMLEQNTQLLFDKELNTLGRSAGKKLGKNQPLSRSNPLLSEVAAQPQNGFLSRQFGSSRSFNPLQGTKGGPLTDSKILGGPNAAYFGSLQRLMPYNLEYDFSLMHERGLGDSMDLDRMQQYWGVTTTEL